MVNFCNKCFRIEEQETTFMFPDHQAFDDPKRLVQFTPIQFTRPVLTFMECLKDDVLELRILRKTSQICISTSIV